MGSLSHKDLMRSLNRLGLSIIDLRVLHRKSYLVIDHLTYPNVEAHLFTAADAAGWEPQLLPTDDVKLTSYEASDSHETHRSWDALIDSLARLSGYLEPFRNRIRRGEIPSVIWSHTFRGWYRRSWESSIHPTESPESFIHSIDDSIRDHIIRLNELGFNTVESCSGLPEDHPDRDPYWPYVMFDERAYPGIIPHLFTLADVAGWVPMLAPHAFDVYVKMWSRDDMRSAWVRLVNSAVFLGSLLSRYRERVLASSQGRAKQIHESVISDL